jgi:hypothetical protein
MPSTITPYGGVVTTTTARKFNSSAAFDGTDDYLQVELPSGLTGDFTIEFWARWLSTEPEGGFFHLYNSYFPGTTDGLAFGIASNIWKVYDGNGGEYTSVSAAGLGNGNFFHYAVVRQGSTLTVYAGGASIYTTTSVVDMSTWNKLIIGGYKSTSFLVSCNIDEFRISNVARYTAAYRPQLTHVKDYQTLALLRMDGVEGGTTFIDEMNIPSANIEYLIVGGGGGGGYGHGSSYSGGGGAGGFRTGNFSANIATRITVTVGAGGTGGTSQTNAAGGSGENSELDTMASGLPSTGMPGDTVGGGYIYRYGLASLGGGGGDGGLARNAGDGASGGGGDYTTTTGGWAVANTSSPYSTGTRWWPSQGNNGGGYAGGGGGAGAAGQNGPGAGLAGNGGAGLSSSLGGSANTYSTGGSYVGSAAGTANRGNGGAGAGNVVANGGAGGSGVVVVRYLTSSLYGLGGTKSTDGSYTVHTFTTSDALTLALPGNPINSVVPVVSNSSAVSGVSSVGQTLSCTDGTWEGDATIVYTYQWTRDTVNISGATSNTYILTLTDVNRNITCVVTGTNSTGSMDAFSNSYYVIMDGLPGFILFDFTTPTQNLEIYSSANNTPLTESTFVTLGQSSNTIYDFNTTVTQNLIVYKTTSYTDNVPIVVGGTTVVAANKQYWN